MKEKLQTRNITKFIESQKNQKFKKDAKALDLG